MIKHEDTSQTSVIERTTDYTPLRTAEVLRQELLSKPGVVVTEIPYHVRKKK